MNESNDQYSKADASGDEQTLGVVHENVCFKCGEKGHYANKCPKGYLAFLSPALKDLHQKRNQQSSNNASMDQSES